MDLKCFNPCFNGYYTFTKYLQVKNFLEVLSFNPCFNGYYTFTTFPYTNRKFIIGVSILVLMDITLLLIENLDEIQDYLKFQSLF